MRKSIYKKREEGGWTWKLQRYETHRGAEQEGRDGVRIIVPQDFIHNRCNMLKSSGASQQEDPGPKMWMSVWMLVCLSVTDRWSVHGVHRHSPHDERKWISRRGQIDAWMHGRTTGQHETQSLSSLGWKFLSQPSRRLHKMKFNRTIKRPRGQRRRKRAKLVASANGFHVSASTALILSAITASSGPAWSPPPTILHPLLSKKAQMNFSVHITLWIMNKCKHSTLSLVLSRNNKNKRDVLTNACFWK